MIKKILASTFIALIAVSITACDNNGGSTSSSKSNLSQSQSNSSKVTVLTPPPALNKKYFVGISPTSSVGIADSEWAAYKELGVKSLRIHIQLPNIGDNTDMPDFSAYDAVVNRAKANDIEIVMLLSYESYKSQAGTTDLGWGEIMQFTNSYSLIKIAEKAITHFKPLGVNKWEIWNEQNGMWNVDVESYAKLLTDLYEKCKYTDKWNTDAIIGFGGIDAVDPGGSEGVNGGAKNYFSEFYKTKAYKAFKLKYKRSPFDAVCFHPYNTMSANSMAEINYNKIASAIKLTLVDVMELNGDKNIPIWITEFGNQEVMDDKNAKVVYEALKTFYEIPQVETVHWFKYCYSGSSEVNYSLVYADGRKRYSYKTFRQASIDIAASEKK